MLKYIAIALVVMTSAAYAGPREAAALRIGFNMCDSLGELAVATYNMKERGSSYQLAQQLAKRAGAEDPSILRVLEIVYEGDWPSSIHARVAVTMDCKDTVRNEVMEAMK